MKAIDAAQLIVNRLSRTGKSVDRSDLTKMLYLLDLTIQKHTGKRLVDEEFSFNDRGPFIEDVYKHFQLWKDDYISGEVHKCHRYDVNDKIRVFKAKQLEIEQMEAKLKAEKEKLDKFKASMANSGIEL